MEPRGSNNEATSQTKDDLAHRGVSPSAPVRPDGLSSEQLSYRRLLFLLVGSIFAAELVAMGLIYILPPLPYLAFSLIDAGVMTTLIFPVLYFLSFRPLIKHIYKRQQAEQALQQKEALEEKFFDSIDLLIAYMDRDFNFIRVNDVYARADGRTPDYFVGKNHFVLYPHPENERIFRQVVESGEPFAVYEKPFEYTEHPDRGKSYWDWRLQPVKGPSGVVEGLVLSLLDVTERKRSQDVIRQLSRIVEQTEDTVVVTDRNGVIEYVNPAFERLTGFAREEALGKRPNILKSGIHDNEFFRNLWDTVLGGEAFQSEIANRKKNGELFYEVKTITPLRDLHGSITHFVATGKDITARKQAEESLHKAYNDLELRIQERTEELRIANSELEDEINVRWRAEAALRQSEERLKRAQDIAHLGSWELDLLTNCLTWSDEVYRIFGLQPQEFGASYESFLESVHPDDRAAVDEAYSESIRQGHNSYEIEHRVVRRSNGEVRFVHEKCEHFRDEQGRIVRSVGMVHDITERKQAEDALRQAAERFRIVADFTHDCEYWRGVDHHFHYISPSCENITGYPREAFNEDPDLFLQIVHPDDRERLAAHYRDDLSNDDAYEIEFRIIRRDGQERWLGHTCRLVTDSTGRSLGRRASNRDITERKRAEELLRYQAALLSNVNDAIIASDAQFRLTAWNSAAESLYGWMADEVIGRNGLEILHTEWTGKDAGEMRRRIAETGLWRGEATQTRKDGTRFPVEVSSIVLYDDGGQVTGYISVNRDITARKQAEAALRESETKYRNLFENMTEEVHFWRLVYDEAGRIQTWRLVDANPPTLHSWDRKTVDEIKGKTTDEIFGPGSTEHYMPVVQKIMTEGVPYSFEDYFSHLDKHFRFTSVPLGDHFITTGADITLIKKVEEALRRSRDELELRVQERTKELAVANRELLKEIAEREEIERQLRLQTTAMEAAGNGIVITDGHGNIQWANPAMLQISGYGAHELIGKSTRVFSSGQHDETYYHRMWETILSGQVWRGETINRRKDGTLYMEEQTITPVRADHDRVTHFIAIKQDITARKEFEQELERQNMERLALAQEEREQRQFAEALVNAVHALNRSLNLNEVLSQILEQIKEVIPYEVANITLLEGESFYDASHRGDLSWPKAHSGDGNRFPLTDFPLFRKMIQTGQPILIDDTRCDSEWVILRGFGWIRSFLSTPLLIEEQVIGFVNLFAREPAFFTQVMRSRLTGFAGQAAAAIQNAWLFEQVQANTERLQSLSRRLVEIQENERLYISRELHDEAGQVLTSLLVDLRLLEKNAAQPEAILKIVAEMERSLNGVIENLHRMAMALRPASLDHVGLVAALRQHVDAMREKHGIDASFRSSAVIERLPSNIETVLYRTVQEALTNVIRHAHATRVDVVLTVRDNKLIVIVEDDGIGFEPNNVSSDEHLGLFGIRERTEMIGGTLVIESAPGKGTTLMLEVDYANTAIGRR